jgi:hypothetical protein
VVEEARDVLLEHSCGYVGSEGREFNACSVVCSVETFNQWLAAKRAEDPLRTAELESHSFTAVDNIVGMPGASSVGSRSREEEKAICSKLSCIYQSA